VRLPCHRHAATSPSRAGRTFPSCTWEKWEAAFQVQSNKSHDPFSISSFKPYSSSSWPLDVILTRSDYAEDERTSILVLGMSFVCCGVWIAQYSTMLKHQESKRDHASPGCEAFYALQSCKFQIDQNVRAACQTRPRTFQCGFTGEAVCLQNPTNHPFDDRQNRTNHCP
jgi:hypothetical protein